MKNDEKIMKELMEKLKNIYDNKDFVCGTISIAREAKIWQRLLDCIKVYENEGQEMSSDDVLALTLALRKEADNQVETSRPRRKVVAAML